MRRITTRWIVLEETIRRKDGRSMMSEGGRVAYGTGVKKNHGFRRGSVKIGNETIDVKAELLLVPIAVLAYFEAHGLQDRLVVA